MFYNIYSKKTDEELIGIASDKGYTDDSKLCAIGILRERGVAVDDFEPKEKELIEKRDTRIESMIAQERYNTGLDRFIALIIDGLVLGIAGWIFKLFNGLESALIIGLIGIIQLALPYLYNIVLHGYCGQTFGKMAMSVKIYDKSEKKLISYKQALIRDIVPLSLLMIVQVISYFINPYDWGLLVYVSIVMTLFLLFWSILEIITMLFDSKKRALHDFMAGTVVLKVNS
jgi:uncharacterized RDD family membrane protein YckC